MQRAVQHVSAQVRVLVRFREIRVLRTHNLSQVDLSAAWTGQQRFRGDGWRGAQLWLLGDTRSSDRSARGAVKAAIFVAALRNPEGLRGRWWVTYLTVLS